MPSRNFLYPSLKPGRSIPPKSRFLPLKLGKFYSRAAIIRKFPQVKGCQNISSSPNIMLELYSPWESTVNNLSNYSRKQASNMFRAGVCLPRPCLRKLQNQIVLNCAATYTREKPSGPLLSKWNSCGSVKHDSFMSHVVYSTEKEYGESLDVFLPRLIAVRFCHWFQWGLFSWFSCIYIYLLTRN